MLSVCPYETYLILKIKKVIENFITCCQKKTLRIKRLTATTGTTKIIDNDTL